MALEKMLLELDGRVLKREAHELASSALLHTKALSHRYALVSPPLLHNTLVNIGLRDRGLCYEYAYDLLEHLRAQNYRSFKFYIAGSKIGTYFEHNSLAVGFRDGRFEEAIILDPWRESGELYFIHIRDDEYEWSSREHLLKLIKISPQI